MRKLNHHQMSKMERKQLSVWFLSPYRLIIAIFGKRSIGRYGAIGLSGSLIDTALFSLFAVFGLHIVLANFISTATGTLSNFALNSKLNFQVGLSGTRLRRFLTVAIVALTLSSSLIVLLTDFGLSPITGKLIAVILVGGIQFIVNSRWTFGGQHSF